MADIVGGGIVGGRVGVRVRGSWVLAVSLRLGVQAIEVCVP